MPLEAVDKKEILDQLPSRVRIAYKYFTRCPGCQKLYWPGTHCERLKALLGELLPG